MKEARMYFSVEFLSFQKGTRFYQSAATRLWINYKTPVNREDYETISVRNEGELFIEEQLGNYFRNREFVERLGKS